MHGIMDVKSYEKYLMKLQISLRKFFIKIYIGINICRLSLQIDKNIVIYNIGCILILRWIRINR